MEHEQNNKYIDGHGNPITGIVIKDWFSDKRVYTKIIVNNGHVMRDYTYPHINRTFFSPMVNDDNLHLCGGWQFHLNWSECLSRVVDGLKPMGFHIVDVDKKDLYLSYMTQNLDKVEYNVNDNLHIEGKIEIGVSVKGKFKDVFDMDSLLNDYIQYLGNFEPDLHTLISKLKNEEVSKYLTNFDYANPESIEDLIITGLILGYPIETTVSIILESYG